MYLRSSDTVRTSTERGLLISCTKTNKLTCDFQALFVNKGNHVYVFRRALRLVVQSDERSWSITESA